MNLVTKKKIVELKDYINYLSLISIERARSGHPGLPLGCSLLGVILYHSYLRFHPTQPNWLARDRFVLSAGHGSMLLYALNYVFMNAFTIKDLANFRQLKSITPGHPEYDINHAIETTTGPLGQGFANAVGIALESKIEQARVKSNSSHLFNFKVYALLGDGCMMEGITQEAASLAGNLGINNLIAIYDDNNISIDGKISITFSEDVPNRFKSLGWEVHLCPGNDIEAIEKVLNNVSKNLTKKPKLIVLKTTIGSGLNKLAGSPKAHGSKAGLEEISYFIHNSTLKKYFLKKDTSIITTLEQQIKTGAFFVPADLDLARFLEKSIAKKIKNYNQWEEKYNLFNKSNKGQKEIKISKETIQGLKEKLKSFKASKIPDATRNISSELLQFFAEVFPNLVGGSADLVASTKAAIKKSYYINKSDFKGRNIAYGVREHAMAGINNGLALSRRYIPFSSTFLSFLDYLKPALRLAAVSKLKHLFIFSHDSIQVGEDGPTHQPIEHINSLRLLPNHYTFRPANDIEMAFSFLFFFENNLPVSIITSRQVVSEHLFLAKSRIKNYSTFKKGGYEISPSAKAKSDIILVGSGSEVGVLLGCQKNLLQKKIYAKVVSLPCFELFEKSSYTYKNKIFENFTKPIYLLEFSSFRSLNFLINPQIRINSVNRFGLSAPSKDVVKYLGFDEESITKDIIKFLEKKPKNIS